jgi:sugar lactone lactonase YvrE
MPEIARCATGAVADAKGRLWVVTMARQLRENEQVQTSISMMYQNGKETSSTKTTGAVDLRTTDAYKLEVFDADGVLLGSIPVGIFVDGIFIKGDRLFLVDRQRGVQIHEFKIKE